MVQVREQSTSVWRLRRADRSPAILWTVCIAAVTLFASVALLELFNCRCTHVLLCHRKRSLVNTSSQPRKPSLKLNSKPWQSVKRRLNIDRSDGLGLNGFSPSWAVHYDGTPEGPIRQFAHLAATQSSHNRRPSAVGLAGVLSTVGGHAA